jgi:hypothetical protein
VSLRDAILGSEATPAAKDLAIAVGADTQGIANTVVAAVGAIQAARAALDSAEVVLNETLRQLAASQTPGSPVVEPIGLVTVVGKGDQDCEHEWWDVSTMGARTWLCSKCGRHEEQA